ncbi:DUF2871 domain-containing protein [Nocardia sp. NEAU-G5]|uniref:DUF2871 domain-containing protein n=1 Tax=Nocardia albiluteola TaxID=2842303 RepID=A0ABS6BB64_9NOCA|nr:DUF2871 domain-containing protein [Nocardia albiluteola]MBU3067006.1 DUF2871 domain-containing protein [Nocardia albiluteola]
MKTLVNTAHIYMIIGLISGLAYREVTKAEHFTGQTELSVVHTHVLALGMLFFLIVLALEKLFTLSDQKSLYAWFFWLYNGGLAITIAVMTLHGTLTVLGSSTGEAIALCAGLGHILLTAGLIVFFITLGKSISDSGIPRTAAVFAEQEAS